MRNNDLPQMLPGHSHVFLGENHATSERRTWVVIWLCGAMMVLEIAGGMVFGSIALVADGLHMSTHAGALLLAAIAYTYARKHANDDRYTFGTGKLGDLAGFTSAVILAMIALLIGYESIVRLLTPVPIQFSEAIPIATLGLAVNIASAWLLSGGHHHGHGHHHEADDHHQDHDESHLISTAGGMLVLSVFETGHPPVFRIMARRGEKLAAIPVTIETARSNGTRQTFVMTNREDYLQSVQEIPEPHAFVAHIMIGDATYPVVFTEHAHAHEPHGTTHRDNNMRAAIVHVMADAAVSVLVIVGLLLARSFGWLWMDPLAGIVGSAVIASWAYGLVRDTGAILLDMNPDRAMSTRVREVIEAEGDQLTDIHLWRLGPGHLGAIVSVATISDRGAAYYRAKLARFSTLSHVTIEIARAT